MPRLPIACATALLVVLTAAVTPARADLIVLQSSAPAIKAGQSLADGVGFEIPAGKSAVFVLPNGATRTVAGPFKGKAGDLTKGIAVDQELLGAVKNYVETGGASTGRVGATRSARAVPQVASFAGWSVVPISATGDYCIDAGKRPELVRSYAGGELVLTIANVRTAERGRVIFAAGARSAPWPAEVALTHGATYGIAAEGAVMRKLQLRLLKSVPSADETLRVLHGQRCLTQMRSWLAGLMRR
ncbi:MAG: hypothetical protein R3D27_15085 [Hyphomicrobiaceae bacterium]